MLDRYMLEFIYIIDDLLKNSTFYLAPNKNIAIDKDYIEYLLSRNTKFRDPLKKLKLWKQLNWIVYEKGRLTSKITIKGIRHHVVVFNMRTYKFLKEIKDEI